MNERESAPGGLALIEALVNTLDVETGTDALETEEGRTRFALTPADTPGARELREALRATLLAHAGHHPATGPRPPELGRLLTAAPLTITIAADGTAALTPSPAAPGVPALTARVAAAITEALLAGVWHRLKCCEAETCRWAYYDRSPASRGRWCSMSVCGARAKMRTYRARTRPA